MLCAHRMLPFVQAGAGGGKGHRSHLLTVREATLQAPRETSSGSYPGRGKGTGQRLRGGCQVGRRPLSFLHTHTLKTN